MMHRKHTPRWGGRITIVATLLAVCAALIPSQASSAPLTKKVNFNSPATVASCTFTVEKVNLTADTITWKVVANARPVAFQGYFNNKTTEVYCLWNFDDNSIVALEFFASGAVVNQTKRVTLPNSSAAFVNSYCGVSFTLRKDGSTANSALFPFTCVPA